MLRLTRYFIVGILTCALGISAGALWNRLNAPISCNGSETGWDSANKGIEEEKPEDVFRNPYPPEAQPHSPAQIAAHSREEIVPSER